MDWQRFRELEWIITRRGEETKKRQGLEGFRGDRRTSMVVGAFSQRKNSMKRQDLSLVLTGRRIVKV
jgi:hypothetical protein